MELKVLTLNLHTYQEHHGDVWHVLQEHGREVYLIAEAIVRENIDVIIPVPTFHQRQALAH